MGQNIGIACDHAGYELKEFLVGYLDAIGMEVVDYGCHSEESVDYADLAHAMASDIETGVIGLGVGICGSGEGMAMTLNKHKNVRAGLCWCEDVARLIKQHNNANVIVLPARFIDNDEAILFIQTWLKSEFEGGRHEARVKKINL